MKWTLQFLIALKLLLFLAQLLIYCDGVDGEDYLQKKILTVEVETGSVRGSHDPPPPPQDPYPTSNSGAPSSEEIDNFLDSMNSLKSSKGLLFHPKMLEYGSSPVCIPTVSSFTITSSLDVDVELNSISADNPQFYPVLFQPQTLARRESVMIRILFLPFYTETASATLKISTSIGDYEYNIVGAPAYNSYRLHPFVGYRIPSGVPFEQPITIYNPHDEVLHIREIFTTEEFISLRGATPLDADVTSSGGATWQLEPGVERSIIHLSMGSSMPGFYSGYVHLKTDKDNIVIPVELQVLEGGLHASPEFIDFGVLTRAGDMSTVDLKLMNSGSRSVEIVEIVPIMPDPHLQIFGHANNRVIENGTEVVVASLAYSSALSSGKVSNKLLIVTNHSNPALATLEVPYEVSSVHGGIEFEFNDSLFTLSLQNMSNISNKKLASSAPGSNSDRKVQKKFIEGTGEPDDIRDMVLTNFYDAPLQILEVTSTTCPDVFFVHPVESNLSVDSLQKFSPIQVQFNRLVAHEMFKGKGILPKSCWLELQTNLSTVRFPLLVIDGSLDISSPMQMLENSSLIVRTTTKKKGRPAIPTEEYTVKLGHISSDSTRPVDLVFKNRNPVRVPISLLRSNHNVTLCWRYPEGFGNGKTHSREATPSITHDFLSTNKSEFIFVNCVNYPPYSSKAVFSNATFELRAEHEVTVRIFLNSAENGPGSLELKFQTPYQYFHIHFPYVGVPGILANSYRRREAKMTMGVRTSLDIRTFSTFGDIVNIDSVQSTAPLLPAVFYDKMPTEQLESELLPDEGVLTAHIMSPHLQCLEPFGRLRSVYIWGCLHVLLEEWFRTVNDKLSKEVEEAMMMDAKVIEPLILATNFEGAQSVIGRFRTRWKLAFPNGLQVPPFDVIFRASLTNAFLHVNDMFLQLPFATTPMYSAFNIPPAEYGNVLFLSAVVRNPFDVTIEFKMSHNNLPITSLDDNYLTSLLDQKSAIQDDVQDHLVDAESHSNPLYGDDDNSFESNQSFDLLDVMKVKVRRRYLNSIPSKHPHFSRVHLSGFPSPSIVLLPHQSAEIGTVAFVPDSDVVLKFNMSMIITNNYTGFHRMDCVFTSGPAILKVNNVSVGNIEGPALEPSPLPSHAVATLFPDSRSDTTMKSASFSTITVDQKMNIQSVNRSFVVNIGITNFGTVQSVVDKILFNGRKSLCGMNNTDSVNGFVPTLQTMFLAGQATSVHYDYCDKMPLRIAPGESKQVPLTFSTDCTVEYDSARISFVSATHKAVVLNAYISFSLDPAVAKMCQTVNFESDDLYRLVGKAMAVMLLVMLGLQLHQQFSFVMSPSVNVQAVRSNREKTRPVQKQGEQNRSRLLQRPNSTSRDEDDNSATMKRGSEFSYLRKGITLSDVQGRLDFDESNIFLEAVEALKNRRVSSYYGDSLESTPAGADDARIILSHVSDTSKDSADTNTTTELPATSDVISTSKSSGKSKSKSKSKKDKSQDKKDDSVAPSVVLSPREEKQREAIPPSSSLEAVPVTAYDKHANDADEKETEIVNPPKSSPSAAALPAAAAPAPAAVVSSSFAQSAVKPKETVELPPVVEVAKALSSITPSQLGKPFVLPPPIDTSTKPPLAPGAGSKWDGAETFYKPNTPITNPSPVSRGSPQRPVVEPEIDLRVPPSQRLVIAPSLSDPGSLMLSSNYSNSSTTPGKKSVLFSEALARSPMNMSSMSHSIGRAPDMTNISGPKESKFMLSTRIDAPPGLGSPSTPIVKPDRNRSISKGMETMVAGIVDTDSSDDLEAMGMLAGGSFDVFGSHQSSHTPSNCRTMNAPMAHPTADETSASVSAPPGFAGALGIYSDPVYESSLFSSPSFFSESSGGATPHSTPSMSTEKSRFGEFRTPPSRVLRSPLDPIGSPLHHPLSTLSLPDPITVPDMDDTDWAAMLTMPLEDMNMKVDSLGMAGISSGSSHWPHHHSQAEPARPQSVSEFHYGSPPMTASDVFGTSQGHSRYHSQHHQMSTTTNRHGQMYGNESSFRTDSRGRDFHDINSSSSSFGNSSMPSHSSGASRSDWNGREEGSVGMSHSQQAYYRGPAQSMQYYRPYSQQHQQPQYQRPYQPRSSSQRQYSGDGYPPLTQDDFSQSIADSLEWPAEWSGNSERRQGPTNPSKGNQR